MSVRTTIIAVAVTACVVGSAIPGAYQAGKHGERVRRLAEVAALNAQHDKDLAAIDRTNREALEVERAKVRQAEADHATRIAAIDAAGTKALHEQQAASDRTIDGLRAGTVRLRKRYAAPTCPGDGRASGGEAQAGTSAGVGDGPAIGGFGEQDVIAILGAARDGDQWAEQLRACQAIVRSDRGME